MHSNLIVQICVTITSAAAKENERNYICPIKLWEESASNPILSFNAFITAERNRSVAEEGQWNHFVILYYV